MTTIRPNDTLLADADAAVDAARRYLGAVKAAVSARLMPEGTLTREASDSGQRRLHGFAWVASLVEALEATANWARERHGRGAFSEIDALALRIGFGEYLAQIQHGIPMTQNEIIRPGELETEGAITKFAGEASVRRFISHGNSAKARAALIEKIGDDLPDDTLGDDTLDMIREQFRRFARSRIAPHAHEWHLADALIPDEVIAEMAQLGAFGICIDPQYGGLGLGKLVMCIVTEELSRAWIAAGSLGTRSEIAGDLISSAGTDEQKAKWLPGIAAGTILPTAVFTEPDTGSNLAAVATRATRNASGDWVINGNKTWITHASRSDLMTILARSEPDDPGYGGLSMFLAGKPRGRADDDFPVAGLTGSEIGVLGYRGMKEYELAFTDFVVEADGLLGDRPGAGFRQLMQTFEGARIQTAARAVGVAWNALELGLRYARERRQFGVPIAAFPRVSDKLALMYAETVMVRELTYHAARRKDNHNRCDIEAGMAKLLAAKVAWSNADCSLQIHGGNGYALEYEISRVLCDARILNIFEGAAEIQAHVIGRGLLTRGSNH